MTRDELASLAGLAAPARRLLPDPPGYTGAVGNLAQLAYLYAGLAPEPAAPAVYIDGLPAAFVFKEPGRRFVFRDPGRTFTLKEPGRTFKGVPRR